MATTEVTDNSVAIPPSPSTSTPGPPRRWNRRRLAAGALILSPLFNIAETAMWPRGSEGDTAAELQAAADHPGAFTAAWALESIGAVLLVAGVAALFGLITGRGRVLATIGAALAWGGAAAVVTGGGFNAAVVPLARQSDRSTAIRALEDMNNQLVLHVVGALILLGLVGALLLALAAWRAGWVGWWVAAVYIAGVVLVSEFNTGYGPISAASFILVAVAEIALGVALFRRPLIA